MTGRRRIRSTFLPTFTRPVRATALAAGALAACASLVAGCGVVPGVTGGTGDEPIKIMTWAPMDTNATNKPGMPALAQAYARWINSRGGINGHKLAILVCNDRNDTVTAAKCAQRAVDEGVVAVVGSYSQHGDAFFPTLESADIPYIGGYGITNSEFESPLSFPVNGGQSTLLAGLGKELAGACGPVALVRPDSIAGDELHVMIDSGLKAGGHPAAADQLADEDATEYSAPSERALDHTTTDPAKKGCVVPALGDHTGTFMDSFRRSREDYPAVRTATVLGSVDQTVIDASGGLSGPYEGSYITSWYPPSTDRRWNAMKKVIGKEAFGDNRIDPADAGVQTTWIAYTVLRAVLESLGDGEVTGTAIRKALNGGLKVDTGSLTPTLNWEYENSLAGIGLTRLVNTDVTLQVVRKGRLVAAHPGFTDVRRTLATAEVN
ncbi:MAG: ABC transporter substrate-binding protein [Streptomyces sp.]|nr:ABC transporter substrate-binding protein [Streptomyces sp.]